MVTFSRIIAPFLLIVGFTPTSVCAWNAVGHQLVAQIAYDKMTPHAQKIYMSLFHQGKERSFLNAATWLDKIRSKQDPYYNDMHYIDIPFSTDGTLLPFVASHNAVSAINNSVQTLKSPTASQSSKKESIKILLHVVGDIHQPLHAATRVSAKYPEGDRGGNDALLTHNKLAHNLHAYWDKGAGVLLYKKHRYRSIKNMARRLEQQYPCRNSDLNPMSWANESHDLAMSVAYAYTSARELDKSYQLVAQTIVKQRIALAGCRLAELMNHIAEVK